MVRTFNIVHNIPAPYRLHLFEQLNASLVSRGLQLHVHFMAKGHADRPHWIPKQEDLHFPHTFWKDLCVKSKGKEYHLNPGLIRRAVVQKSDYLLVGGPWDSITAALVSIFARRRVGIAWYESNTHNPGKVIGCTRLIKRVLLSRYKWLAVPGEEGIKHAGLVIGDNCESRCVLLPNLIDERRFDGSDAIDERYRLTERYGVPKDSKFGIWPARLIPEKGIARFLKNIPLQDLNGWKILIIGQGPLEQEVREAIKGNSLNDFVSIVDYVPYSEMPALYRAADLFLLPSVEDSNPLSVIEAMHSGLPILVSNRIGNFPEALIEGQNGWGLDPFSKDSVHLATKRAFGSSKTTLTAMGKISKLQAQKHWSSENAINRFLDRIL